MIVSWTWTNWGSGKRIACWTITCNLSLFWGKSMWMTALSTRCLMGIQTSDIVNCLVSRYTAGCLNDDTKWKFSHSEGQGCACHSSVHKKRKQANINPPVLFAPEFVLRNKTKWAKFSSQPSAPRSKKATKQLPERPFPVTFLPFPLYNLSNSKSDLPKGQKIPTPESSGALKHFLRKLSGILLPVSSEELKPWSCFGCWAELWEVGFAPFHCSGNFLPIFPLSDLC